MSMKTVRWEGIEGIVLDAVGTLIDPSPSVAATYAQAAERQGLVVELAEVKRRFHQFFRVDEVDEQLGPLVTDERVEFRRWRRIVGNVLPDLPDPDRAFEELWDHFGKASSWHVFDDVAPALAGFREQRIDFVIASNFDARLRSVVAGLPALAGCVDKLVISSEVGFRKPHRTFYHEACARMGLEPDRVLCVGDDCENDVQGPIRAGLGGLLVVRDGRRHSDLACFADLASVAQSLAEFRADRPERMTPNVVQLELDTTPGNCR